MIYHMGNRISEKDFPIIFGNKVYDYCRDCHKVIRVNKPIFGSMHLCLIEEQQRRKQEEVERLNG